MIRENIMTEKEDPMHFIIYFCLFALFFAIKCIEISECGTTEKIRFEGKKDAEIENNDNLKTVHDLGEELVAVIKNLIYVRYLASDRIDKELSICISESSIDTNKKKHNEHNLADIINEIRKRSLVNTLGSIRKNLDEIKNNIDNDSVFFQDPNSKRKQILLSKNEFNTLIDVFRVMEVVTWYLYVQWIDMPSNANNDKRKEILYTIALNDREWKKGWDDLLHEIHRLLDDTSSGYDGIVPLGNDSFDEFQFALSEFYCSLYWFREMMNENTIKTATDLGNNKNSDDQLLRILESLCTENGYANTNILVEVKKITSQSTIDESSTKDVNKSNTYADKQQTEQKQVENTWPVENKRYISWFLIGINVVLVVCLLVVAFILYKKQGN